MRLRFLLDEHVAPEVADAARRLRASAEITPMRDWRGGACLGLEDDILLAVAAEDGFTIVTYDLRTIVPLLVRLATAGRSHAGVMLVDQRTLTPSEIGSLARALIALWDAHGAEEWTGRVVYLAR